MSKSAANQRSANMVTESSKAVTSAAVDASSGSKVSLSGSLRSKGFRYTVEHEPVNVLLIEITFCFEF